MYRMCILLPFFTKGNNICVFASLDIEVLENGDNFDRTEFAPEGANSNL